ncbi:MAG: hypothetical protein Q9187_001819 [Circinaria calcarea]
MAASSNEIPNPKPLKRQLFNRPAWARPQATPITTDIFHRSSQTYATIAAEEELRRKRRLAKKEKESGARGGTEEREEKRRRVADESEDENLDDYDGDDDGTAVATSTGPKSSHAKTEIMVKSRSTSPVKPVTAPKTLVHSYEEAIATSKLQLERTLQSKIIDLGDDEEPDSAHEDEADIEVTAVKVTKPSEYDDFELSDEEFPELARQAREKARRKRLQADISATTTPDPPATLESKAIDQLAAVHAPTPLPPPLPEPVISILITSNIPNTLPLIVNRRLSQRLREVRVTWCQKQSFTSDFSSTVVLTWRGKRLFDITSCKSLGIGVDADGNIVTKGEKDILGEENRQIHMEAMTEEMFEDRRKAKAEDPSVTTHEQDTEEPAEEQPQQEEQVKIILKAKGFADFKLIVKPSTLMSRIIGAFRGANKIEPDKDVYLVFDGERLDPPTRVGDTELSDMDYIDVYVK